ncbi:MAG: hypothetical protein ACYC3F_01060 [Gemmatimonadaceae bacterium]
MARRLARVLSEYGAAQDVLSMRAEKLLPSPPSVLPASMPWNRAVVARLEAEATALVAATSDATIVR